MGRGESGGGVRSTSVNSLGSPTGGSYVIGAGGQSPSQLTLERVAVDLHAHDPLDKVRTTIGDAPAEEPAECMCVENARSDAIDQFNATRPHQIAVEGFVRGVAGLARHELIDVLVLHSARSRPLARLEDVGGFDQRFVRRDIGQVTRPERVGMIRRSSVARTIEPIHRIAGLHEVVHPTWPASEAHHVCALRAAAMHHDDRIRITLLRGNHVLHEHLTLRDRSVRHRLAFDAHEEPALTGESQCGRLGVTSRVGVGDYGWIVRARRRNRSRRLCFDLLSHPREDRLQCLAVVLLEHHHRSVAANASLRQEDQFNGAACRPQHGRRGRVVGLRRFSRHDRDRYRREERELPAS